MALVTKRIKPSTFEEEWFGYQMAWSGTKQPNGGVNIRNEKVVDRTANAVFGTQQLMHALTASFIFDVSNVTKTYNATYIKSAFYDRYTNCAEIGFGDIDWTGGGTSAGTKTYALDVEKIKVQSSMNFIFSGEKRYYSSGYYPTENFYEENIYQHFYKVVEPVIEYVAHEPTITDFEVRGRVINNEMQVTWQGDDYDTLTLEVIKNDFVIHTFANITGVAGTKEVTDEEGVTTTVTYYTYTIPKGTLKEYGDIHFKLSATGFGVTTSQMQVVALKRNEPIISSLEPNMVEENIDDIVTVTFITNEFVNCFELTGSGIDVTGTNERSIRFAKNTFALGKNTIKLKVFYTPNYNQNEVITAEKTAVFTGYGKPNPPVVSQEEVYQSATPTIVWGETQEQTGYRVRVMENTFVVQTIEKNTKEHFCTLDILENKKKYTVFVSIKNSYHLYSLETSKEFETNFNDITPPSLSLFGNNAEVLISANAVDVDNFASMSIFRKGKRSNWIEIVRGLSHEGDIVDYTCGVSGDIFYKARIYDTEGGYADSEIKTIRLQFRGYRLSNVEDFKDNYRLDFVKNSFAYNETVVYRTFAGAQKPRAFRGENKHKTGAFTAMFPNEVAEDFIAFLNQGKVFCYRDYKGEKLYISVQLTGKMATLPQLQEVSFNITEVDFREENMYGGGSLTFLEGAYQLMGEGND